MRELPWRQRRQLLAPWSDPIFRDSGTAALALGYGRYVWSWRFAVEWLLVGVVLLVMALAGRAVLPTVSAQDLIFFPVFYVTLLGVNLYVGHKLKRRAADYLERHGSIRPSG